MAVCSCVNITKSEWQWDSPAGCNNDATKCLVDNIVIKGGDYAAKTLKFTLDAILVSKDKTNACKLWNTLKNISDKSSWVKSDGDKKEKVRLYRDELCVIIGIKCTCEDKLDDTNASCKDDKLIQAKKDCTSPKVWSNCRCQKGKGGGPKIEIGYVDGCIDPKAFNYYCKGRNADKSFKCGDNNDTLPEYMNHTQCEYRVNETLKYRYILSNLDNPDPEDSYSTWPAGPIVISGDSSFDSPDDDSWLNREYKQQKDYWTKKCSNISDTTINFSSELGLYDDQGDTVIQADLVNALLKFTNEEGKVGFLKNYKVMIMDENNGNLGIVSLYKNNLTLDVRGTNGKILSELVFYRASKNVGSEVSSTFIKNAPASAFRTYFNGKNASSMVMPINIDYNKIISMKPVEESVIGLGTLLERKDYFQKLNKPIIGLGGLL